MRTALVAHFLFQQLLELVTQLAMASTTITIGCTLNGYYNMLHHLYSLFVLNMGIIYDNCDRSLHSITQS